MTRPVAFAIKASYTHGALIAAKNDAGDYLLVRQRTRERGCWGMPGGFMSTGEEPEVGAARELKEETGLQVDPTDLVKVAEYKQPWAWHYDHLFLASIRGDGRAVTRNRQHRRGRKRFFGEIRAMDWFALDDMTVSLTSAANEAFVRLGALDHPPSQP